MPVSLEARSPIALLDDVDQADEVLVLSYTSALEYFERFAMADARALGARVTIISDATMVHADPVVVRRAGTHYLDARALCRHGGRFHPKLVVIAGHGHARVAIGSGNLTMAGWHANAELWTVLHADEDGGPATLRQVSAFLRDLAEAPVSLSPGAADALDRAAARLDDLPADDDGPVLLHSLHESIADQLPPATADELVMHAPFHDPALAATRRLLDQLKPSRWTTFVRQDTAVDGHALLALAEQRQGRVAWIATRADADCGRPLADDRYWHGKLIQWREGPERWALTGSPNLSKAALLGAVANGGNCELALLSSIDHDLTPVEGEEPPGGIERLRAPVHEEVTKLSVVLMAAVVAGGEIALQLHGALPLPGELQRYDVGADQWRRAATLVPGSDRYVVSAAAAPTGTGVRLLLSDESTSNSVFVTDLTRVRRPQIRAIGKARVTPADIARLGLGDQLLADLEALRPHLLRVGASVLVARPDAEGGAPQDEAAMTPAARAAPGLTLEEFLAACDPVLGHQATEFALVLPVLPGVGAAIDDAIGTLDSDLDTDEDEGIDRDSADSETTLGEQLRRCSPDERARYRRFVERLVQRAASYPTVVRTGAVRCVLNAAAADVWSEDVWPDILRGALEVLAAPGDEPSEHEQAAAAALAAMGLAVLRTRVERISRRDEHALRYEAAGRAVAHLLTDTPSEKIDLLAGELTFWRDGVIGSIAAYQAIEETLRPLTGAERAVHLLLHEHDLPASARDGMAIELHDAVGGVAEARLLLALKLADDPGPLFVRAQDGAGRDILAAWCAPWLAVERNYPAGPVGRAWKLGIGEKLGDFTWDDMPATSCEWYAGMPRPHEVAHLLELIE